MRIFSRKKMLKISLAGGILLFVAICICHSASPIVAQSAPSTRSRSTSESITSEEFVQNLKQLDFGQISKPNEGQQKIEIEDLGTKPGEDGFSQKVRIAINIEQSVQEIVAASSSVYPLALLSGKRLHDGIISRLPTDDHSFQPRQVTPSPGVAVPGEILPYLPQNAEAFRKNVLEKIQRSDVVPPNNVSQTVEIVHSASQFETKVGTKFGFLGFSGAADFARSASNNETFLYVLRRETHFSLEMANKGMLKDWFANQVSADMARDWMGDLPVYVDKVYYGKIVLIMAIMQADSEQAKTAVEAAFLGNSGQLTADQQRLLFNAKLRLFVHGGEGGQETSAAKYDSSGKNLFEEFRNQALAQLQPSKSTQFSQAIGFSVESMEEKPQRVALIVASNAIFERTFPHKYNVSIRPLKIRIGQAGYDAGHEIGDFHAGVNLAGHVVQSGYIPVHLPEKDRDIREAEFAIPSNRIGGPFAIDKKSGELFAMLGESDSGPDAKEIIGWPETFDETDKVKYGDRARKWDDHASIINQKISYDLGEIFNSGRKELVDGHEYRAKDFTAERNVEAGGRVLKNSFTFEILVQVPDALSENEKSQLLRD